MKKTYLKPIAVAALFSATFFSCAGSGENTNTAENTETGAEIYEEEPLQAEGENLSNVATEDYANLFEDVSDTENRDILALARTEPQLSVFVELMDLSGLSTSLIVPDNEEQEFTFFIPTNEAFESLSVERMETLRDPQNRVELTRLLNAHVLPSEVPLIEFDSNQAITTQGEDQIPVRTEMNGNQVFIGGAQIVKSDVDASNGIIHVVDAVIDPENLSDEAIR